VEPTQRRATNQTAWIHKDPCYSLAMAAFARISIDPAVRFGKPCVKGTRITVGEVLGHLSTGVTVEDLLKSFPQLTREDVLQCLAFAAERERRLIIDPAA